MGGKDRLNEVLQAYPLTHELRTARDLPSQGHSALIARPDLAPKFYPFLSSPRSLDLPIWAVVATGAGAEPSA